MTSGTGLKAERGKNSSNEGGCCAIGVEMYHAGASKEGEVRTQAVEGQPAVEGVFLCHSFSRVT